VSEGLTLWRVFPYDRAALLHAPFSASYIHAGQTAGRFDLHDQPPVLYLAGSAEHAVGEVIQGYRGRGIGAAHLRRHGYPLALAAVTVVGDLAARIPDCTDPATLLRLEIRPDSLASHDRRITQAIARRLHAAGEVGFRWWSALTGAWHSVVLFSDRYRRGDLTFGSPELLSSAHEAVITAARLLGIAIRL
jgi:hypothetical protein